MKSKLLAALTLVTALGTGGCSEAEADSEGLGDLPLRLSLVTCNQLHIQETDLLVEIDRIRKSIVRITAQRANLYELHGPFTARTSRASIARERSLSRQIDAAGRELGRLGTHESSRAKALAAVRSELRACAR